MTHSVMLLGVARPTQGDKVINRLVSLMLWLERSIAVNVMDLKRIICSAVLASKIVTLKGRVAIASKVIIILGLLSIFLFETWVGVKPVMNFAYFVGFLAICAAVLRAGPISEVFTAFRAIQNSSNWSASVFSAQGFKGLGVLLFLVSILASGANFLARTCGAVCGIAHQAAFVIVRHTVLHIRSLRNLTYEAKHGKFC